MSFKTIYSRIVIEKVSSWPEPLQKMAFQAAEHAALNPQLHDYARPYTKPYLQKHPTTNHQYTLYFLILSQNEIFIAWINDQTCLHTTRGNHSDPCNKEFLRLRDTHQLEHYSPRFHHFHFEVNPDSAKPIRCRSSFLGFEILLNSGKFGANEFVGHAFNCDDPNLTIAKMHTRMFLVALRDLLKAGKMIYEFRFVHLGHEFTEGLLRSEANPAEWTDISDDEEFVLKLN